MEIYTIEEVNQHNTDTDCWVVIDKKVYDISEFVSQHPGGKQILVSVSGDDVTDYFYELHRKEILEEVASDYLIGELNN